MTSREERRSNFIRDRYTLLSKPLASSPDLLSSLSEKLLEASLIDECAAKTITNNGGRDGAHLLLDILELRLHQSQDYEPLIAGLLKGNEELEELCQPEMENIRPQAELFVHDAGPPMEMTPFRTEHSQRPGKDRQPQIVEIDEPMNFEQLAGPGIPMEEMQPRIVDIKLDFVPHSHSGPDEVELQGPHVVQQHAGPGIPMETVQPQMGRIVDDFEPHSEPLERLDDEVEHQGACVVPEAGQGMETIQPQMGRIMDFRRQGIPMEMTQPQMEDIEPQSGPGVPTAFAFSASSRPISIPKMEHFGSILSLLTQALSNPSYNLDCLKVRISLYLQYAGMHRQNTPEVDQFLQDLEKCSSPSSIVDILTRRSNLVSFLNFQLLDAVKSEKFDAYLERYALIEYRAFTMNSINSIAFLLATPILAVRGLPEITVSLHSSWGTRPYSQWLEIMEDNAHWSRHVLIKSMQIKPSQIVITYCVLPFVWPKVVNDLVSNVERVKRLSAAGATIAIPDEDLLEAGNRDYDKMKYGIQRALAQMKISTKAAFDQEMSPLEVGSLADSKSYDRKLFCSPPPKTLQCPVCLNVLKDPLQLLCCACLICKGCHRSNKCPLCRTENPVFISDKRCKREIMQLKVTCPERDCYWTGTLDCLENQRHDCPRSKDVQQKHEEADRVAGSLEDTEQKMIYVERKSHSSPVLSDTWVRGRKVYTVTGLEAEEINWLYKGSIIIHVPAGVVPPGQTCDITITPVQPSECVLPPDAILVSEVFEVTTSCDLQAPITIILRHCVRPTREDERNCLSFAKAESGAGNCYFKECENGIFTIGSEYGELECKRFSTFLAWWRKKLGLPCPLECCVRMVHSFLYQHEAHIVVTKNNGDLMEKALKSIENKRGTRVNVMKVVMDDITIETEEESDDGLWEVKPRQNSPSVIEKRYIENYNGKQGAPPSLSYMLLPALGGCSSDLIHTFNFTGMREEPCSIKFDCPSPRKGDKVQHKKDCSSSEVDHCKKIMIRKIEDNYQKLCSCTENSLPTLARKLLEVGLVGRDLVAVPEYDPLINAVIASLDLDDTILKLEKDFGNFLKVLDDIGGPARSASKVLSEIKEIKVLKETLTDSESGD